MRRQTGLTEAVKLMPVFVQTIPTSSPSFLSQWFTIIVLPWMSGVVPGNWPCSWPVISITSSDSIPVPTRLRMPYPVNESSISALRQKIRL